jgi:4a-hydroxytetrahydrobiopterin dehydratase
MTELAEEGCVPCRKGSAPLSVAEQQELHASAPEWEIKSVDGVPRLVRGFSFKNFTGAMRFAVAVGRAADEQDHHPELTVGWGHVQVGWWTHAIGGLHRNDFIMAARTDDIYAGEAGQSDG